MKALKQVCQWLFLAFRWDQGIIFLDKTLPMTDSTYIWRYRNYYHRRCHKRDSNPQPCSSYKNTQPYSQTGPKDWPVFWVLIYMVHWFCVFMLSHKLLERFFTLQLPEYQGTLCSRQVRYLKSKWLQQNWNPQPPSS